MNKGRLYEELIPIEQLSYKGYNTPELANACSVVIVAELSNGESFRITQPDC